MPGKSRRKGKYSVQNLKNSKPAQAKPVVQAAATTQVNQAGAVSSPSPSPRIATDSPRVTPVRPGRGASQTSRAVALPAVYVTKELRTIGILAGAMLIIVIVLARILG